MCECAALEVAMEMQCVPMSGHGAVSACMADQTRLTTMRSQGLWCGGNNENRISWPRFTAARDDGDSGERTAAAVGSPSDGPDAVTEQTFSAVLVGTASDRAAGSVAAGIIRHVWLEMLVVSIGYSCQRMMMLEFLFPRWCKPVT
jgi:hypothetical protein